MKTSFRMLTITGLLTIGGLTSCGQTFDETPATTPTMPTSPTSGPLTLMPGQTVTGIDGVQVTAPKDLRGQVAITIEKVIRDGGKVTGYKISSKRPIDSEGHPFNISIKKPDSSYYQPELLTKQRLGFGDSGMSGTEILYSSIPYTTSNDSVSFKVYEIRGEESDDTFILTKTPAPNTHHLDSASLNIQELVECEPFERISKEGNFFAIFREKYVNNCAAKEQVVEAELSEAYKTFKSMYNIEPILQKLYISPITFLSTSYDESRKAELRKSYVCTFSNGSDKVDEKEGKYTEGGAWYKAEFGYNQNSTYVKMFGVIHICDNYVQINRYQPDNYYINPSKPISYLTQSVRHEAFHSFQNAIIVSAAKSYNVNIVPNELNSESLPLGSNYWMLEGLAVASESSTESLMSVRKNRELNALDFTLPFLGNGRMIDYSAYSDANKKGDSFYRYQDLFVYLGNRGGFGLDRFKDVISYPGISMDFLNSAISNLSPGYTMGLSDAWWQFGLNQAIEKKIVLRPTDKPCEISSFITDRTMIDLQNQIIVGSFDLQPYQNSYKVFTPTNLGANNSVEVDTTSVNSNDVEKGAVYVVYKNGGGCSQVLGTTGKATIHNLENVDKILIASGNSTGSKVSKGFSYSIRPLKTYAVKVNATPWLVGGKVEPDGTLWAPFDGKLKFDVIPNKGFEILQKNITVSDGCSDWSFEKAVGAEKATVTINRVTDNCTVDVKFTVNVPDVLEADHPVLTCPAEIKKGVTEVCTAYMANKDGNPILLQPDMTFDSSDATVISIPLKGKVVGTTITNEITGHKENLSATIGVTMSGKRAERVVRVTPADPIPQPVLPVLTINAPTALNINQLSSPITASVDKGTINTIRWHAFAPALPQGPALPDSVVSIRTETSNPTRIVAYQKGSVILRATATVDGQTVTRDATIVVNEPTPTPIPPTLPTPNIQTMVTSLKQGEQSGEFVLVLDDRRVSSGNVTWSATMSDGSSVTINPSSTGNPITVVPTGSGTLTLKATTTVNGQAVSTSITRPVQAKDVPPAVGPVAQLVSFDVLTPTLVRDTPDGKPVGKMQFSLRNSGDQMFKGAVAVAVKTQDGNWTIIHIQDFSAGIDPGATTPVYTATREFTSPSGTYPVKLFYANMMPTNTSYANDGTGWLPLSGEKNITIQETFRKPILNTNVLEVISNVTGQTVTTINRGDEPTIRFRLSNTGYAPFKGAAVVAMETRDGHWTIIGQPFKFDGTTQPILAEGTTSGTVGVSHQFSSPAGTYNIKVFVADTLPSNLTYADPGTGWTALPQTTTLTIKDFALNVTNLRTDPLVAIKSQPLNGLFTLNNGGAVEFKGLVTVAIAKASEANSPNAYWAPLGYPAPIKSYTVAPGGNLNIQVADDQITSDPGSYVMKVFYTTDLSRAGDSNLGTSAWTPLGSGVEFTVKDKVDPIPVSFKADLNDFDANNQDVDSFKVGDKIIYVTKVELEATSGQPVTQLKYTMKYGMDASGTPRFTTDLGNTRAGFIHNGQMTNTPIQSETFSNGVRTVVLAPTFTLQPGDTAYLITEVAAPNGVLPDIYVTNIELSTVGFTDRLPTQLLKTHRSTGIDESDTSNILTGKAMLLDWEASEAQGRPVIVPWNLGAAEVYGYLLDTAGQPTVKVLTKGNLASDGGFSLPLPDFIDSQYLTPISIGANSTSGCTDSTYISDPNAKMNELNLKVDLNGQTQLKNIVGDFSYGVSADLSVSMNHESYQGVIVYSDRFVSIGGKIYCEVKSKDINGVTLTHRTSYNYALGLKAGWNRIRVHNIHKIDANDRIETRDSTFRAGLPSNDWILMP